MKKVIIFIFSLILLSGCKKEVILEDNTNDFLNINTNEIEVYEDIYLNDIINILNQDIKLTSDNYKIDTTKLGVQNLKVYYEYKNKKYVYNYQIEVKDTTPPIVFSGTNKTVKINSSIDMCNLITYGDNYSGDIKCNIEGTYDLSKEGTYKLLYTLTDSSNNFKTVNVTLNVKKNIDTVKPQTTRTKFSDIYLKHKSENTEIGIDVSKWQGNIDFNKVKKAGASFVMIRIGSKREVNGKITIDEYFLNNIKNAKEAGLNVGVYLYSVATTKEEAIDEADWVIETLNGEKLELPVVFDWEDFEDWNSFKLSFYDVNTIANAFIDRINSKGYIGMLYSSKFYLETIWTNKENHPVWLAHYTLKTDYKGNYNIWQLSNTGQIDGINGNVDIDIMYK